MLTGLVAGEGGVRATTSDKLSSAYCIPGTVRGPAMEQRTRKEGHGAALGVCVCARGRQETDLFYKILATRKNKARDGGTYTGRNSYFKQADQKKPLQGGALDQDLRTWGHKACQYLGKRGVKAPRWEGTQRGWKGETRACGAVSSGEEDSSGEHGVQSM